MQQRQAIAGNSGDGLFYALIYWRLTVKPRLAAFLLSLSCSICLAQRIVNVSDDASLRQAGRTAQPGDTIRLAPGRYCSLYIEKLAGIKDRPIVIESATSQPAEFVGGSGGIHLSGVAYLTLRNLVVRGATDNGVNIDDGGDIDRPSHHVLLDRIRVFDIGPRGNHDGIKLSGLDNFELRDCLVEGWGGSSVDMVGCHDGLIVGCTFRGKDGFSQDTGVQAKGGSRNVIIRRCRFDRAGQRAVNIGGSTGLAFFRPRVPQKDACEAKDITVEGCTFVGSMAPIAFVGCDGATVRYNTFYRPEKWLLRILQETRDPRFVPCRNGAFEHNVAVFRRGDLRPAVNIGPNTDPQKFVFSRNVWFCIDEPSSAEPKPLPGNESQSIRGRDPKLKDPQAGDLTVTDPEIVNNAGADALPRGLERERPFRW